MSNRAIVASLETRLVNAWPAFEVEVAEGWLLRFAENYSKRANSASPISPDAALDPDLVRHMVASFEARGVTPCFRLTGLEAEGTDGVLDRLGYVDHDPSVGMVAPIDSGLERDAAVKLAPVAKPAWIASAADSYGGDKANAAILGRIVRQIRQPAAFATLSMDGDDVAWGLAVAERGYVGLYDIVVAPRLRGLGLGRRLVTTLMAWGSGSGAERAYLQVREANEVATGLYASLGFKVGYRYRHRIPAGGPRKAVATATSPQEEAAGA